MASSKFAPLLFVLAFSLALPLAAQEAAQEEQLGDSKETTRVLVWLMRNDVGEGDLHRTVTDMVTAALQRRTNLDVITLDDVASLVDVESLPSLYGCPTVSTCFRPIANKMGVRLVVTGSVGKLENTTIVNFNLYDVEAGRILGGETLVSETIDAVPTRLRYHVNQLFVDAGFDDLDFWTFVKSPFFVGGMTTFAGGLALAVGAVVLGELSVAQEQAAGVPDPGGNTFRFVMLGAAVAGGVVAVGGLGSIGWSLVE